MIHRTLEELEAGVSHIRQTPKDVGRVEMIVTRPAPAERNVVDRVSITMEDGLVGDNWKERVDETGDPNPEAQVTVMNARYADLISDSRDSWSLAGDQLYVDFDLGVENLPPGSRIRVGTAILEVSKTPHTGCAKFAKRFGADALRFVNSELGKSLRLRGLNALLVQPGDVTLGDTVTKI